MKTQLKKVIWRTGGWLLRHARKKHIINNRSHSAVVLMYHRVLPDELVASWPFKSLVLGETAFRRQVEWLGSHFKVLRVSDFVNELHSRIENDSVEPYQPLVAITFDDGYWDNALIAAPILEANGLHGTFYVTSSFIDTEHRLWFDVAARYWMKKVGCIDGGVSLGQWMKALKAMSSQDRQAFLHKETTPNDWCAGELDRAMNIQELKMITKAGHEIGCHTRTHPILTQLTKFEMEDEIRGGKEQLERLGCKVLSIAYPNGNSNSEVQRIAVKSGLASGVGTRPGCVHSMDDVFDIPRVDVNMERLLKWSNDPAKGLLSDICLRSLR